MARRGRWRKAGRWALRLLGVALVGAVGAGLYVYDYPRVAADLPEAVLAYRDAGLPWTAKDLAPNPPVKPEENAAPLLRAAMEAWPRREVDERGTKRSVYDDRLLEAMRYGEPVQPFLKAAAAALDLAHEAAVRPHLDFGRDWDLGPMLLMPEGSRVKVLVKALVARASLRAEHGEDAGAIADLEDAQRLGVLLGQEPSVISVLIGVACDRIATAEALRCLALAAGRPTRLALYREWLAQSRPPFDLQGALRGQAYETVAAMRNLDRMRIGTSWNFLSDQEVLLCDASDAPNWTFDPKVVRRDGYSEYLRPRAYLIRALRLWTELSQSTHGLKASMDEINRSATGIQAATSAQIFTLSEIFDFMTLPVLPQFGRSNHRVQASRTLALLYADALLQHARTEAWPASCPVPDPLGDGTFHTRIEGGRFRIWSVGENGVDDGGLDRFESRSSKRSCDDLVAVYPPFPRRIEKRLPPSLRPPGVD